MAFGRGEKVDLVLAHRQVSLGINYFCLFSMHQVRFRCTVLIARLSAAVAFCSGLCWLCLASVLPCRHRVDGPTGLGRRRRMASSRLAIQTFTLIRFDV